jgi:putative DNA primase/helicase
LSAPRAGGELKSEPTGKRLVIAIETEDGKRINESLIKELTGGDYIRGRRMRENTWQYKATHSTILATNYKPIIRGVDHGIWRRVRLVAFSVTLDDSQAVLDMPERLKDEYTGILAWLVRGCMSWRAQGLSEPRCVLEATSTYKREQNRLIAFLEEETEPGLKVQARPLYVQYCQWMKQGDESPLSEVSFAEGLEKLGKGKKLINGRNWYIGIHLRIGTPTEYPDFDYTGN